MRFAHLAAAAFLLVGCVPSARQPTSAPAPATAPAAPAAPAAAAAPSAGQVTRPTSPALPPVPLVLGPLAPHVVYPPANALIQSRDSNFIFGSVGNGHAALTIDGTAVPVYPNGSFLAYLPLPRADSPRYDLVAILGADTARLAQPVRLLPPLPVLASTGPLAVDTASLTPAGGRFGLRDDDPVRVAIRAPANATVMVRADSEDAIPLVNANSLAGGRLFVDGDTTHGAAHFAGRDSTQWATTLPARMLRDGATLVVVRGADTVQLPLAAVGAAPPQNSWAELGTDSSTVSDTDDVITARPTPGGTYAWLLMAGTPVQVTGWRGDFARVRLDRALEVWVDASAVRLMPFGYAPPERVAGNAQLISAPGWEDLVIPMSTRPPFLVEEGDHEIRLTLYGVHLATDAVNYPSGDSLVRVARWTQLTSDRGRFTLRLSTDPFGYLVFWNNGRLTLRVRRPPVVHRGAPLRGLTIAVDAGHPPIGATGPTGLWEPVATLAIAQQLEAILERRGATVVMTRTTAAPVALGDRPIIARRANADALISIHLNALPDGIDPFTNNGTGAYFFHPQSAPLARALQAGMVARLRLPDLGYNYDNLALARPTWMPAVLCEGAFIMMPDQEAALRTAVFQRAYAEGVVDGLTRYFRSLVKPR